MTYEALRELVRQKPFAPLLVTTTAGRVFEVRRPEHVLLCKSAAVVQLLDADGTPSDLVEFVPYPHIAGVQTRPGQAA